VREIEVPRMWRHIGALCHVTDVTEEALIHNLAVVFFVNAVNFTVIGRVNQIKQCRERAA
jgi:hypothetical protein